jgi:hypothetical protein
LSIRLPPRWSLDQLQRQAGGRVVVWATASVGSRVAAVLPWRVVEPGPSVPPGSDWIVVVGGGELMDRAKALRPAGAGLKLALIPSIWGSGAEASPIVVRSHAGRKEIRLAPESLPDVIVYWPELAHSVPAARQRTACGDCWAHALEGFLSPLATADLRQGLAEVIRRMLALPLAYDPQWFELSALACAGQAQAGAGLVHGIAHTLEGPLWQQQPEKNWHHAKLCSVFLSPVMRLNRENSNHWRELMADYRLAEDGILPVLHELFEPDQYRAALPVLRAEWRNVLRDPCSRTNSVLVRPGWLERFETLAPS